MVSLSLSLVPVSLVSATVAASGSTIAVTSSDPVEVSAPVPVCAASATVTVKVSSASISAPVYARVRRTTVFEVREYPDTVRPVMPEVVKCEVSRVATGHTYTRTIPVVSATLSTHSPSTITEATLNTAQVDVTLCLLYTSPSPRD